MRVTITPILKRCILVFPLMAGCKIGNPDPDPPQYAPGKLWVRSAAGATGFIGDDEYYILDSTGGPIIGGRCICIPLHIVYLSTLDGLLEPGGEYATVNNWVIGAATTACEERADELGLDEDSNNCDETVQAATPYVQEDCTEIFTDDFCQGLPGAETGGETSSPLSPLEDPSSHVSCSSGTSCEVSEEIVEDALGNPGRHRAETSPVRQLTRPRCTSPANQRLRSSESRAGGHVSG